MNNQNTAHAHAKPIRCYPISIIDATNLKAIKRQNRYAYEELSIAFRYIDRINPETLAPVTNILDEMRIRMEEKRLFTGLFRRMAGMVLYCVRRSNIETDFEARCQVISGLGNADGSAQQIEFLLEAKNNDIMYWCPDLDTDIEDVIRNM